MNKTFKEIELIWANMCPKMVTVTIFWSVCVWEEMWNFIF